MRNAEKTSIWLSVYLHMLYLKSSLTALPLHLHLSSSLLVNAPSPQLETSKNALWRRQNFITENWKPCTLDLPPCGMRNTEKIEVRPSLNSFLQIISTFIYPFPPFIAFCWLQTTFNFPDFKSIWNVQYFKSIWNVQHFKSMWNVQHFKSIWNVQHFKSFWNVQHFRYF